MEGRAEAHLDLNPFWGRPLPEVDDACAALELHRSRPDYEPTPLIEAASLASELGIHSLFIKDESERFGLNSFKALGPSYALSHLVGGQGSERPTVSAASEGNHGRALAWAAKSAGCEAVIYVGRHVEEWRRKAIRELGARVHVVDGSYDDAVVQAAVDAERHGWLSVSDTAMGAAEQAPAEIVRGYTTLFHEARAQLSALGAAEPTLILLQAGVGGLAAAGVQVFGGTASAAILVTVEPLSADCLRTSMRTAQGQPGREQGTGSTAMSCLNCARPSATAWPWIRSGINALMAVDDEWAVEGVRRFKRLGIGSEPSGAAGLGGLLALLRHPQLSESRRLLECGRETRALIINTEGARAVLGSERDREAVEMA